ncbi:hypothetical protein D3C73_1603590 [compost metagenome]
MILEKRISSTYIVAKEIDIQFLVRSQYIWAGSSPPPAFFVNVRYIYVNNGSPIHDDDHPILAEAVDVG